MVARRKTVIILGVSLCIVAIAIAGGVLLTRSSDLNEEQIKEKFNCARVTAVYRPTDVYCQDPNLYREHTKSGTVID